MTDISNTKRIAKNTLMLYFRQLLILFVSLYTVRVILNTLGEEDYGIYTVVGGVVTFFSFLSGTMASATQRFFAFALGQRDEELLKKSFSVNLIIYLGIALLSLLLLESVGLWFVNNKLNVPQERFSSAVFVFHFASLTFLCTVLASPFMAIIIAHEDMHIYAYISIIEVVLKLLTVFALKVIFGDKLQIYAILLLCVGIINTLIYLFVCMKKYYECQFKKFYWDKKLFKDIFSFTSWTLFGQLTSVGRTQAVTILINQFFNPIIVSARAIATQVASHINVFANNFSTGLYPSIIKSYAANQKEEMQKLVFTGCKIAFFLTWVFSLPLFIEMDYILTLWLQNPPEYAVLFTKLCLIECLIMAIGQPLATAARATGKMKSYELSLGSVQIMIFVTDFILFKFFDFPAFIVFVVAAIGNFIMFMLRFVFLYRKMGFPVGQFFYKVMLRILAVMGVSATLSLFIDSYFSNSFGSVCLSVMICLFFSCLSMFFLGFEKKERNSIVLNLKNKLRK